MSIPTILVADDDPLLVALLEIRLKDAGYQTATAKDGVAALEALCASKASVVVLDAMMPRMGGFEVLRRLRADKSKSVVRIIMLTALRHEDDAISALKQGADDYVTKPFSVDELMARIERFAPCGGV